MLKFKLRPREHQRYSPGLSFVHLARSKFSPYLVRPLSMFTTVPVMALGTDSSNLPNFENTIRPSLNHTVIPAVKVIFKDKLYYLCQLSQ